MRSPPFLAGILGMLSGGCASCGCDGGPWEVENEYEAVGTVSDVSEWVDEEGQLLRTCDEACATVRSYGEVIEVSCELMAVTEFLPSAQPLEEEPPPQEDGQADLAPPAAGGAGGASSVEEPGGAMAATLRIDCLVKEVIYCTGRRDASWKGAPAGQGESPLGAYLGREASSEAASVGSFSRLARALESWGAPSHFIQSARAAQVDETRHARSMGRLAARWGGRALPVRRTRSKERPLLDWALENAREGCALETFAALVALKQARGASSASVRRTLSDIAVDETRHAQLAWELHAWFLSQLTAKEGRRVEEHLNAALAQLSEIKPESSLSPEERTVVGLPEAAELRQLAGGLRRAMTPYVAA